MLTLFSILLIILMVIALLTEIAGTEVIFLGTLTLFLLTGILTPSEALSGFSNQGVIVVALLFPISKAVQDSGFLYYLAEVFLRDKDKGNIPKLMFRMLFPVTILSAFFNNTPIVMLFTPMVKKWTENRGLSASKFLIPLSYTTILGGLWTLIGTSTTLVVHGLMIENGLSGFSMFELARVGIPLSIVGWLYLSFVAPKFLPENKKMTEVFDSHRKEYVIEMNVEANCGLISRTVEKGGLRDLDGVYLVEIERENVIISPVENSEVIEEGDRLIFAGLTHSVLDLNEIPGLIPVDQEEFRQDSRELEEHLVEVVVAPANPLLGQFIKESGFRARYDAAIIGVHRNGARIRSKIGSIRLKSGDALLMLASPDFIRTWQNSEDFIMMSGVSRILKKSFVRMVSTVSIVIFMIVGIVFSSHFPPIMGTQPGILHFVLGALLLLVLSRAIRGREIKTSIRWDIFLTIASALAISKGLQNTGAAQMLAEAVIRIARPLGPYGVMAGLYLLTTVFTEIITNNAAAALIFPVALSAAQVMGVNPMPFLVAITIAASASFLTPIGYQTNLIVQGAGGYKFSDYFKVGLPLTLLTFGLSMLLIPMGWGF